MANASMQQMLVMIIENFILFCSFISSQTLIGAPTEIYFYGTIFMYQCIGSFIGALIGFVFFLPVFKQLNIISVYEVCLHSQMHALSLLNYYGNNDKFMAFRWSKKSQLLIRHEFQTGQPYETSHQPISLCFQLAYEFSVESDKKYGNDRCFKKGCLKIQYRIFIKAK